MEIEVPRHRRRFSISGRRLNFHGKLFSRSRKYGIDGEPEGTDTSRADGQNATPQASFNTVSEKTYPEPKIEHIAAPDTTGGSEHEITAIKPPGEVKPEEACFLEDTDEFINLPPILEEPSPPTPFLLLPRELRDMVYTCVYNNAQTSDDPLVYPNDINRIPIRLSRVPSVDRGEIHYPDVYPKYPLLPILQLNRQIRQEFREFINYMSAPNAKGKSSPLRYELDLLAAEHPELTPTWVLLPLPPEPYYRVIPELTITYRTLISSESNFATSAQLFSASFFGYVSYGYPIVRLLSDFFNHGPQAFYDPRLWNRCKPYVKKLIIGPSFWCKGPMRSQVVIQEDDDEETQRTKNDLRQRLGASARRIHEGLFKTVDTLNKNGYFNGKIDKVEMLPYMVGNLNFEVVQIPGWDWKPEQRLEMRGFSWGLHPWSAKGLPLCRCDKKLTGRSVTEEWADRSEGHLH
ncbi:hypothetical protein ABW19_dt0202142 [Dactylella cylindrospora]|nr:hypothetical protein ABW19_dt0202142 [Dactylella cylindrospora]